MGRGLCCSCLLLECLLTGPLALLTGLLPAPMKYKPAAPGLAALSVDLRSGGRFNEAGPAGDDDLVLVAS